MIKFKEFFHLTEEKSLPEVPDSKVIFDKLFKGLRSLHATMLNNPNSPSPYSTILNFVNDELEKGFGEYYNNIPKPLIRDLVFMLNKIILLKRRDPYVAYSNYIRLPQVSEIVDSLLNKQIPQEDPKPEVEIPTTRRSEPRPSDVRTIKRGVSPIKSR